MPDHTTHLDASEADATMASLNARDAAACEATAAANDAAIRAQHARMKSEGSDAASMAALAGAPNLDPAPRHTEHTATPGFAGHDLSAPGPKK